MKNYVAKSLKKEVNFIKKFKEGTQNLFESTNGVELLNNQKIKIKAIRDNDNKIYLIEKRGDKISVYYTDIYNFNKEQSIQQILYWNDERAKTDDFKIYNTLIASFEIGNKNLKQKENDFIKQIKEKVENKEMVQVYLNYVKKLKQELGIEAFSASLEYFECNYDSFSIKPYMDFLNKEKHIDIIYADDFYLNLSKDACKDYQQKVDNWIISINALTNACKINKLNTKNPFVFNDLDNNVFVKNNILILTDQSVGFYIHKSNDENFEIYEFNKEYQDKHKEIKKISEKIKNNTPLINQTVLSVKDGNIININSAYMSCLELNIEHSKQAMIRDEILEMTYPVDITTYKYQKDYYAHVYKLNEFEFITQAMMTLGGGFNYNREEGNFIDTNVKYIKDLPSAPIDREQTLKKFNYLMPKQISHLNKDWLDAIKYAVEVLKRDRPTPLVVSHNKSVDEAIDEAIKYYSSKIKSLEKKKLSNN